MSEKCSEKAIKKNPTRTETVWYLHGDPALDKLAWSMQEAFLNWAPAGWVANVGPYSVLCKSPATPLSHAELHRVLPVP